MTQVSRLKLKVNGGKRILLDLKGHVLISNNSLFKKNDSFLKFRFGCLYGLGGHTAYAFVYETNYFPLWNAFYEDTGQFCIIRSGWQPWLVLTFCNRYVTWLASVKMIKLSALQ